VSPTLQDLSNDTTFSKIQSRVPVPLKDDGAQHVKKVSFFDFLNFAFKDFFDPLKVVIET